MYIYITYTYIHVCTYSLFCLFVELLVCYLYTYIYTHMFISRYVLIWACTVIAGTLWPLFGGTWGLLTANQGLPWIGILKASKSLPCGWCADQLTASGFKWGPSFHEIHVLTASAIYIKLPLGLRKSAGGVAADGPAFCKILSRFHMCSVLRGSGRRGLG